MADNCVAPMSKTKMKQSTWPDPLVIAPTETHTHSFIFLHGRGSNAERFGLELLDAQSSENNKTLAAHFPGMKFIFPTAKKRRAVAFNRTPINQWFDLYSLDNPLERQHIQYDGLRETTLFVHDLINQEAQHVGVSRVIIGGLSQGCAAALHVLLNFHGEQPLLGFVGMSGWLPFAEIFEVDDGDNIFAEDGITENPASDLARLQTSASNTARDIASLLPLFLGQDESLAFPQTPVFLGHGKHDQKVPLSLGAQARDVLQRLGCDVRWKEYDEGHWYKVPDEIDDLVVWLKERTSVE
ncbi:Alpha/Beta hydrolase protein [Mycena galericulata]|nr:Alpha/Beta hydrolase protein [Mycena galericulata]